MYLYIRLDNNLVKNKRFTIHKIQNRILFIILCALYSNIYIYIYILMYILHMYAFPQIFFYFYTI